MVRKPFSKLLENVCFLWTYEYTYLNILCEKKLVHNRYYFLK